MTQIPNIVNNIKLLLPDLPKPYPFIEGCTVYDEMIRSVPKHTYGKMIDKYQRNVFIIDEYFIFQRYTDDTHNYMSTVTWNDGEEYPNKMYDLVYEPMWNNLLEKTKFKLK
jgi:hypothetical protein